MGRSLGGWPTLSGPNRDGSRHVGVRVLPDARDQLVTRGFVVANQMFARSVDLSEVARVRVGDVLDVRFDVDKGWWVWRGECRLGRLTWSHSTFAWKDWRETTVPRIDDGTLQVIRLVLDERGIVRNCGGIVRPRSATVSPLDRAVPEAQVYVPTLRARITDEGVDVTSENMPGAPRVGSQPSEPAEVRSRSLWRRMLGR